MWFSGNRDRETLTVGKKRIMLRDGEAFVCENGKITGFGEKIDNLFEAREITNRVNGSYVVVVPRSITVKEYYVIYPTRGEKDCFF